MINFEKVRRDIRNANAETATGLGLVALAETLREMMLLEKIDHQDQEVVARKVFGIPEPEQTQKDC